MVSERRFLSAILLALCTLLPATGHSHETGPADTERHPAYVFGTFPFLPPLLLEQRFAPWVQAFSDIIGQQVRFRTKPSFQEFRRALQEEQYDWVFLQPFDYVIAHELHGYIPLLHDDTELFGLIVVLEDSPLARLRDLRGHSLSTPPPVAAISHLAEITLHEAGLNIPEDVQLDPRRDHHSCLHQVLIGKAQACVVAQFPLAAFEAKTGIHFRVLAQTPTIPPPLFAAHPRIKEATRTQLVQALSNWHTHDQGRILLGQLNMKRLIPATDEEYDRVRHYRSRLTAR